MVAFIVVLAWMVAAACIANFVRPGRRSLKTIQQVVARLAYEQRYGELLDFVEPHLGAIENTKVESADTLARVLYRSRSLLKFIASDRPSFAPRLLMTKFYHRFDFSNRLLEALMQAPGSLLYDELRENQNLSDRNAYVIPASNVLLSAYLSDVTVAAQLGAYKPIGDEVLRLLGAGLTPEYRRFLNGNSSRFEEERWNDPTHAAIRFFDVMVRAAVDQNIDDHMWLYYLPHFVEGLEAIFDPENLQSTPPTEFPSRSADLIYRCFSVFDDWVMMAKAVAPDSPHAAVPGGLHEGTSSIPSGAAICMGTSLYVVVMSDRLPREFRLAMFEQVLATVGRLDPAGPIRRLRDFLILSLLKGGQRSAKAIYAERLQDLFADTDHVLRGRVGDFRMQFSAEYGRNIS